MTSNTRVWVFDGKEYTAEDLACINNIAISTIFSRAFRNPDATLEYLSAPSKRKPSVPLDLEKERKVFLKGELITLREASAKYNQDYVHLVYRYEHGVRGERLLRAICNADNGTSVLVEDARYTKPHLLCGQSGHYTMSELLEIYSHCRGSEDAGIVMCDFTCLDYIHADWLINELEKERDKRRLKQ